MRKSLLSILITPTILASCSPSQVNSLILEGADPQIAGIRLQQEASIIRVKNAAGKPISGAQILIGTGLNAPFSGNLIKTDSEGQATVPPEWTEPTHVSVQARGFVPVTYLHQAPGPVDFQLRPLPSSHFLELRGVAGPLPVKNGDGLADFALVMPALSRQDMLSFDMGSVISNEMDTITAAGQKMPVPSNISIPRQQERYSIINVTFEKPLYRTYFSKPGRNRVYAIQGVFPFKSTADALRSGKSYFDLVNSFTVTAGAYRDINLADTTKPQGMDLPTQEMLYDKARYAVGPRHESDEYYLAVSLAEKSDYFVPTDFKRLMPNEKIALRVHTGSANMFLGVLKKKAELENGGDRMSAALLKFSSEISPRMLPLIANPKVAGDVVTLPRVSTVSGINPLATYALLSMETATLRGNTRDVKLNPLWEVYASEWITDFELPAWPEVRIPRGAKRWEINVIGSQLTSQAPIGPAMLESATHVTHSSSSF